MHCPLCTTTLAVALWQPVGCEDMVLCTLSTLCAAALGKGYSVAHWLEKQLKVICMRLECCELQRWARATQWRTGWHNSYRMISMHALNAMWAAALGKGYSVAHWLAKQPPEQLLHGFAVPRAFRQPDAYAAFLQVSHVCAAWPCRVSCQSSFCTDLQCRGPSGSQTPTLPCCR